MVSTELILDNNLANFNKCSPFFQDNLPGFKIPQQFRRWTQNDETETLNNQFPEIVLQAHLLGEHQPKVEIFEMIADIEKYIKQNSSTDLETFDSNELLAKYILFRDSRRKLAKNDNSDYVLRMNKSFVKLRKILGNDAGVAEQIDKDQEEADSNGKAEYFMTENSIVFLHPLTWSRKKNPYSLPTITTASASEPV